MQNKESNYYSNVQLKFSDEELKTIKKQTHKKLNNGRIIKVN